MFRRFSQHVSTKNQKKSVDFIRTFLTDQSQTSHLVSAFEVEFVLWDTILFLSVGVQRAIKFSGVKSRLHFTRQILQDDEHLCNFLPDTHISFTAIYFVVVSNRSKAYLHAFCKHAQCNFLSESFRVQSVCWKMPLNG